MGRGGGGRGALWGPDRRLFMTEHESEGGRGRVGVSHIDTRTGARSSIKLGQEKLSVDEEVECLTAVGERLLALTTSGRLYIWKRDSSGSFGETYSHVLVDGKEILAGDFVSAGDSVNLVAATRSQIQDAPESPRGDIFYTSEVTLYKIDVVQNRCISQLDIARDVMPCKLLSTPSVLLLLPTVQLFNSFIYIARLDEGGDQQDLYSAGCAVTARGSVTPSTRDPPGKERLQRFLARILDVTTSESDSDAILDMRCARDHSAFHFIDQEDNLSELVLSGEVPSVRRITKLSGDFHDMVVTDRWICVAYQHRIDFILRRADGTQGLQIRSEVLETVGKSVSLVVPPNPKLMVIGVLSSDHVSIIRFPKAEAQQPKEHEELGRKLPEEVEDADRERLRGLMQRGGYGCLRELEKERRPQYRLKRIPHSRRGCSLEERVEHLLFCAPESVQVRYAQLAMIADEAPEETLQCVLQLLGLPAWLEDRGDDSAGSELCHWQHLLLRSPDFMYNSLRSDKSGENLPVLDMLAEMVFVYLPHLLGDLLQFVQIRATHPSVSTYARQSPNTILLRFLSNCTHFQLSLHPEVAVAQVSQMLECSSLPDKTQRMMRTLVESGFFPEAARALARMGDRGSHEWRQMLTALLTRMAQAGGGGAEPEQVTQAVVILVQNCPESVADAAEQICQTTKPCCFTVATYKLLTSVHNPANAGSL